MDGHTMTAYIPRYSMASSGKILIFNQEESTGYLSIHASTLTIVWPHEYSVQRWTVQMQPQKPRRYHLHTEMLRATADADRSSRYTADCVTPDGP